VVLSPPLSDQSTPWKPRQVGRVPDPDWGDGGTGWLLKLAAGSLVLALLAPFLVALIFFLTYRSLLSDDLPRERPSVTSEFTRVFDAAGNQIALLREYDLSIPVSQDDIPKVLKDAVIAAEDRRFYEHDGVDDRAVFRALWANLTSGGYVEGASTITQQYVRMVYVGTEKTIRRKLQEASLARRVEKELSKEEILHRYLSRVYLGSGTYGVGAAAHSYFQKSVRDLSLSEAALLAGLIRLPSVNEPRSNPQGAEAERQRVLGQMLDQGRISPSQHAEAMTQRVFLREPNYEPEGSATVIQPEVRQEATSPYYADYVRRYLVAKYGEDRVYRGGLQVHTALQPSLQVKAEAAVAEALKGTSAPLEMALVSVEPGTGFVRALVGGRDFATSQVNLALGRCQPTTEAPPKDAPLCLDGGGTGRQPGSAFKPFTLAEALEDGMSPDKVYRGPSTYRFPNCRGDDCTVSNVESSGYGSLSLRQATAYSVNTVYAQLVTDVGVIDTADMAHRLGLTMINPDGDLPNGEPYGPSLTLGAAEVSPLDMAASFAVFPNGGRQMPHTPVVRIETNQGEVLEDNRNRKPKQVLSPTVADQVNEILKGVVEYGTGTGADFGHPDATAGKTGTSEDYGDAWFVGYTPQLSTAIWMGFSDSRRPLTNIKGHARIYGGTIAAPTWKAYMTEVAKEIEITPFVKSGPPPTLPPATTDDRGATNAPASPPATIEPSPPSEGPVVTTPPVSLVRPTPPTTFSWTTTTLPGPRAPVTPARPSPTTTVPVGAALLPRP
jgi:penicillin-binding protein 1A